jgi:hypothetical protein
MIRSIPLDKKRVRTSLARSDELADDKIAWSDVAGKSISQSLLY